MSSAPNNIDYLKTFPDSVTVSVGKERSRASGCCTPADGPAAGLVRPSGNLLRRRHEGSHRHERDQHGRLELWQGPVPDEEYTTTTVAWKGAWRAVIPVDARVQDAVGESAPGQEDRSDRDHQRGSARHPVRFVPTWRSPWRCADGRRRPGRDAAKAKALIGEATKLMEDQKPRKPPKLTQAGCGHPANTGAWQLLHRHPRQDG